VLERGVAPTFVCEFERVAQWLGNVGEIGPNENSRVMTVRL